MKTISPFKSKDTITLNLKRNFSKVLIVKIDADFAVQGKLIDRKALPKAKGDKLRLGWGDLGSKSVKSLFAPINRYSHHVSE